MPLVLCGLRVSALTAVNAESQRARSSAERRTVDWPEILRLNKHVADAEQDRCTCPVRQTHDDRSYDSCGGSGRDFLAARPTQRPGAIFVADLVACPCRFSLGYPYGRRHA